MVQAGTDRKGDFRGGKDRRVYQRRVSDLDTCGLGKRDTEIIDTTAIVRIDCFFTLGMGNSVTETVQPVVQIQTANHFLRQQNDQENARRFQN